jgi:tetratricopeptide (TPR) repeat protein
VTLPAALEGRRAARAAACRDAADALLRAGKAKEALRWYEESLRHEPKDAAALAGRGACLLDQGELAEALRCFEAALAQQPGDGAVSYACAAISARLGHHEDAARWLLQSARLAPDHARRGLQDPAFAPARGRREFQEAARLLRGSGGRPGDENIAYQ